MAIKNIHFINPARNINKNNHKEFSKIQTLEHFINFGIYSIIQELEDHNISTSFHDFQHGYLPAILRIKLAGCSSNLVGISIISAFNALSANCILEDVKKLNKNNIIVIGGQHYIGKLKDKAFELFPKSDIVVSGEGEVAMLEIARQWSRHGNNLLHWDLSALSNNIFIRTGKTFVQGALDNKVINIDKIQNYSYKNYPDINKLFPSVEYSRGCPHHCTFCANTESNRKNFRSRSVESLKKSIIDLLDIYSQRPLRFYLQASNFVIRKNEMGNFLNLLSVFNGEIEWRTEVRVDTFDEKYFQMLYDAGLRVIDIGLDSASEDMLKIMKKSAHSAQYLNKATSMLRAAKKAEIFTKINFLIHPGDTRATLEESKNWLRNNKQHISAISVCPALIFPGSNLEHNFEYYRDTFGSELITCSPLSKWGVFEVNPSSEVSLDFAQAYSVEISQSINSRENYAYAKSFGYHGAQVFTEDILDILSKQNDKSVVPYYDN